MVDLAIRALVHDKARFAITIAGVAFAVLLALVQVGLFMGLLRNASVTIENLDADLWVLSKGATTMDFAHAFPNTHVNRVRATPGVARADNLIVTYLWMVLPTGAEETVIGYALDDFSAWSFPWNVLEGDLSELRRGQFLFMDDSANRRLGPFKVGDYRELFGHRMKIIGTTKEAMSFTTSPICFINTRRLEELAPMVKGSTMYIIVKLAPGADRETVRAELARQLPNNEVLTKEDWAAKSRRYWIVSTGLGLNLYFTVFLGCFVGVLVVAQTLYSSTMEQLKEFGTLKAIGATNRIIFWILARQAMVCAILGYIVALPVVFLLKRAVLSAGLTLQLTPDLMFLVLLGTLVLCVSASALSYRKVAGVDPALVFRG